MPERIETLVLGSGNGGMYLAWHMARSGRRTAVVERRWIGGSCPNINCLPSKNEIWSAKVADLVHHAASFGTITGSVAIGDSWRRTTDLQIQYGLRVDASQYTKTPEYNQAVESEFGRRNDRVPTPISVSPRIGFSWTVGQAQEIAAFTGASRTPRAVVRGGIGVFSNGSSAGQIGGALDNTGLPSGTQQIYCVGPASPIP